MDCIQAAEWYLNDSPWGVPSLQTAGSPIVEGPGPFWGSAAGQAWAPLRGRVVQGRLVCDEPAVAPSATQVIVDVDTAAWVIGGGGWSHTTPGRHLHPVVDFPAWIQIVADDGRVGMPMRVAAPGAPLVVEFGGTPPYSGFFSVTCVEVSGSEVHVACGGPRYRLSPFAHVGERLLQVDGVPVERIGDVAALLTALHDPLLFLSRHEVLLLRADGTTFLDRWTNLGAR